ncbi:hypothetical protein phiCT9441A_57 (endogenous virus) [Clostridium phage phiCT9441A]|uniref:hypothetical protein n=1 Tax=Clostridium phage phiCT9441A TaxID=1567014 RepID=UPI0005147E07|nr:hypothetical protein [Clostridium tetani]YP_009219422.1 hypothetical protein phiCT9441A_57 [Clostridium phage phiCT9441A]AJA42669.1 hypothetical protein phiCT9441A_57 [Clostridium phage phiCT9441A]KGI40305.1 hypothetical protein LA33_06500 [Clostridium tetani ATCC 9441]SUY66154.1 Uncharacterised protein [Clostridium tetani]
MKIKRSKLLLISAILGALYSVYLIWHFGGGIFGSKDGVELAGAAIATALVTPHMILVVLATIFNWVAYFSNKRGFALTGAILYSVAGVIFMLYIMFVIPSIVLSFIGYAKLKKIIESNKTNVANNEF